MTIQEIHTPTRSTRVGRQPMPDSPEFRRQQGRCVECGQDLRTVGRGEDGRCRACETDRSQS